MTAPARPVETIPPRRSFLAWWARLQSQDVWLILLLMVLGSAIIAPDFLSAENLSNLLDNCAIIGLISLGQFLVILSGGFDLSVAGVLALAGMIAAASTNEFGLVALPGALLVGAVLGAINGLAVTKFDIPPFIATLGMAGVARGIGYAVSEQTLVANAAFFDQLRETSVGPVPLTAIVWLGVAFLLWILLRRFRIGQYIAAVGGNNEAARLAGVNVARVKLLVYTLSGLLAGLAGLLYVVRSGSGVPQLGLGWELDSIAIVVIGGSNLFGGSGQLPKALAATIIYLMIGNVMNLASVDPYFQSIMAAVIVVAVVVLRLAQNRDE